MIVEAPYIWKTLNRVNLKRDRERVCVWEREGGRERERARERERRRRRRRRRRKERRKSCSFHKEPINTWCISPSAHHPHPHPPPYLLTPSSWIWFLAHNAKQRADGLSKIWSLWGPLLSWLPRSDTCLATWVANQWPPARGCQPNNSERKPPSRRWQTQLASENTLSWQT